MAWISVKPSFIFIRSSGAWPNPRATRNADQVGALWPQMDLIRSAREKFTAEPRLTDDVLVTHV